MLSKFDSLFSMNSDEQLHTSGVILMHLCTRCVSWAGHLNIGKLTLANTSALYVSLR